tara:strand:- start:608 stop:1681 length:1074 start_codon:yes stop_codon:yes gene_type:complete
MLKDGTLDDSHEVLDLLKNPNEFEDYREFIGQLIRNYLLNHDAFLYAEGSTNRAPATLFSVKNQTVTITPNGADQYPQTFQTTQGFSNGVYSRDKQKGKMRFYDGTFREMYHIHGYTSRIENTLADSPLEAAALEAKQQILGKKHNLKIIENGGRLSMAVIMKGEHQPSPEQFNEFKASVLNDFSGSDNAGKVAVYAASDMDIKEMGMNNKDMDFSSLDTVSRDSIFMRYGIPLPIVSPDRQTFNNFDRAIEDLYDRAVLPYTQILFSGLTKMLRARYKDSFESITYNPEDIPALKGRMLEELKKRREINLETVNEMREGLPNREPIAGGDIFYQSSMLIPAGEDLTDDEPFEVDDE